MSQSAILHPRYFLLSSDTFFPSCSSGYSRGVLAPSLALLANQDDLLNLPHPLDQAHWRSHVAKGKKLRAGLVEASQGLQGSTGMVDLEVVVGKVGPGDLKTLDGLLKVAVYRTL